MGRLISIRFIYNNVEHYCLVRIKNIHGLKEYHITIMNGELEELLHGNHVILEVQGKLMIQVESQKTDQGKLKLAVANALSNYLAEHKVAESDMFLN